MTRLSFWFSLAAVCLSIGTFVAVQLQSNPAPWEPSALNNFGYVLVVLAVAFALTVERGAFGAARAGQVATAVVAVAFAMVGLVKLYGSSSRFPSHLALVQALQWDGEAARIAVAALAFGLIGARGRAAAARIGLAAAALIAVGSASYALSLKSDFRSETWYLIAGTAAFLAASAAAGMTRKLS